MSLLNSNNPKAIMTQKTCNMKCLLYTGAPRQSLREPWSPVSVVKGMGFLLSGVPLTGTAWTVLAKVFVITAASR